MHKQKSRIFFRLFCLERIIFYNLIQVIALNYILLSSGGLLCMFFLWISIVSLTEQERRASVIYLLGGMGRMGLLMTPRLGPRVRIGVVTTNIELVPDPRGEDKAVIDFCFRCKKCAVNCPVHAIPDGDPEDINGVRRWQINQEACYIYWTTVGTDCGRCVAVCPFSHPDNLFHRFVRWGIRHSWLINKLALPLDELFYGKKPARGPIPKWLVPYCNK